jgi:enoyl-CoA hydratase
MNSTPQFINVEMNGHVALVTLNRPPVNALNAQMRDELDATFANLGARPEVYAAVLTGGSRIFSAGVDVNDLLAAPASDAIPRNERYQAVFSAIEQSRIPVVASVNGYALGGGCELILACDIRVSSEDAFFALPEINLGGVPGIGGPQRLARLVGAGKAKQMVLSGCRIKASEAHRVGLIDELAEPGQAISVAMAIAQQIASKPPLSVQAAKQAINLGRDLTLERAMAMDLRFVGQVAGTEDRKESLQAFLEKRPANLTGR